MGLFNFKKKNKIIKSENQEFNSKMDVKDHDSLIKQATQLKKENRISEAIDLIKKAIQISPNIMLDSFKLSNYLHSADRKDEAYAVLNDIKNIKYDTLGMVNMNYSIILDKELTLLFKDKAYYKYIRTYFLWLYNRILAHSCQENFAKENLLEKMISSTSLLDYIAPTKMSKCLKELGVENLKDELHRLMFEHLKSIESDLKKMRNLSNRKIMQTEISNFKLGHSNNNINCTLTGSNNKFMNYFLKFNSENFLNYLNEVVMIRLKNEP